MRRPLLFPSLFIPLFALGCDQPVTGDVPCELVAAHLESLGVAATPSALPEASQLELANALAEASAVTSCDALSQAERSCQLRAESLAAAQSCVSRPANRSVAQVVENAQGLSGPTAAPPLPISAPPGDLAAADLATHPTP